MQLTTGQQKLYAEIFTYYDDYFINLPTGNLGLLYNNYLRSFSKIIGNLDQTDSENLTIILKSNYHTFYDSTQCYQIEQTPIFSVSENETLTYQYSSYSQAYSTFFTPIIISKFSS